MPFTPFDSHGPSVLLEKEHQDDGEFASLIGCQRFVYVLFMALGLQYSSWRHFQEIGRGAGQRCEMGMGHILVVDDEPQIRRVMRTTLVAQGYEVSDARTGDDALELIRSEKYDLVLLDVNMPGISGPGNLPRNSPRFRTPDYLGDGSLLRDATRESPGARRRRRWIRDQAIWHF